MQNNSLNEIVNAAAVKTVNRSLDNQRGQGLIEYLVIVALMGVATIAIVRVMGQTVSSRFASVTAALQGKQKKFDTPEITKTTYQKRDLGSFMEGAGGGKSKGAGE